MKPEEFKKKIRLHLKLFTKTNMCTKEMDVTTTDLYNLFRSYAEQESRENKDTKRLNALQNLTRGYGNGWILRQSTSGRGMRLHETSDPRAKGSVRNAIDKFLEENGINQQEERP